MRSGRASEGAGRLLGDLGFFSPSMPASLTEKNYIYLTNRFHFAVRLYSDNAQMTSKRGENKEVRYEPQASSVTDVLTTF